MIGEAILLLTSIKFLLLPLYHSTDFEVHRNWLAVTYNLTINQWYYEDTSEWTLDYPPLFAWFEHGLSHIAKFFDPEMLVLTNHNYASTRTVLFQRLSVIITDFVFIYAAKRCSDIVSNGKTLLFILLVSNPGLLMVDHIHFQYNGFLYGILLLSITDTIKGNYLTGAFWFAVLINFKHIYLYISPVYVIYLLRAYCFTVPSRDGVNTAWYSFSISNLSKLGAVVIFVFALSFGPFIHHLPQIISRLFPFKRGLCHAYWAPNFWALYNFADKCLSYAFNKIGWIEVNTAASMTGGLVQEYDHTVLPTIKPLETFLMTLVTMLPALIKMWSLCADKNYRGVNFVRCMVICATCSFMFGWHVHEKAILMILIPMSFLSVLGDVDGRLFLLVSTVGHYSLFPLLYPKNLLAIKLFMLLTHTAIIFGNIPWLYEVYSKKKHNRGFLRLPMLKWFESYYVYSLLLLCFYENVVHPYSRFSATLPFLPLMLTSVYCGLGVFYFFLSYYSYFLTFNLSRQKSIVNSGQAKKVW